MREHEEAEPQAVFWYCATINYSHTHAKDGWSFNSCSLSALVRQQGKERTGFTPVVGATAQGGTTTSFFFSPSHVDALVLQHRVSPALLTLSR